MWSSHNYIHPPTQSHWSDRNSWMLVVQRGTTVGWAFVYKMPQVEETTEKTSERTREKGDSMADSRREKVGGQPVRKRKSSSTATEIFRNNRRGRERRSQRKGVRMGAEKWSSRWRPDWLNSGGDNPKVGGRASTTARKRENREN